VTLSNKIEQATADRLLRQAQVELLLADQQKRALSVTLRAVIDRLERLEKLIARLEAEWSLSPQQQTGRFAMTAKSRKRASLKAKCEAIASVYGIPVDPDVVDVNFLYSRRHLATVPGRRGRELKYIIEVQDLEAMIWKTLDRIYERDGARFWREAGSYLHKAVTTKMQSPPEPRVVAWVA
jgi:hypothetical protein